jgi:hypothetical protein
MKNIRSEAALGEEKSLFSENSFRNVGDASLNNAL